jgi:hypothetical protein
MGKGKIKFTQQYQPVNFGDRPSTKTVDGSRIATIRAAEERRFEQLVRERIEEEFESRWSRIATIRAAEERRFGRIVRERIEEEFESR